MDLCPPGQCGVRSLLTKAEPMAIANGIIYPEAKIAVAFYALNNLSVLKWKLVSGQSLSADVVKRTVTDLSGNRSPLSLRSRHPMENSCI